MSTKYGNSFTHSKNIVDIEVINILSIFFETENYTLCDFQLGYLLGTSKKDIGYWLRKNVDEMSHWGYSFVYEMDLNSIIIQLLDLDASNSFKVKRWLEEKYQKFGYLDIFKFGYYLGSQDISSIEKITEISNHITTKCH